MLDKDESTEVTEKLNSLNEQLKKAGQKEVTEENDVLYSIHVGSEMYELVYEFYLPKLWLTGDRGKAELNAIVLTEKGVVYSLKETVTIYSKANGVKISEDNNKLTVGQQVEISAELIARTIESAEGDKNTTQLPMDEEILTYSWSSENRNVVAISNMNSASCQLEARETGTTKVNLVVVTKQGNTYTCSMTIVVEKAVENPEESAT